MSDLHKIWLISHAEQDVFIRWVYLFDLIFVQSAFVMGLPRLLPQPMNLQVGKR